MADTYTPVRALAVTTLPAREEFTGVDPGASAPVHMAFPDLRDSSPTMLHARLEMMEARFETAWDLVKPSFDRAVALMIFLVTLPILLLVALSIKLDSQGPVIFKQARCGRYGKEFLMWKFRTMTTDAEEIRPSLESVNEREGACFKMRDDPRVTRVGKVLRRLSLDELPQLLNVLRGDMSLVGPRPALPSEVVTYDTSARGRLIVMPGLSGPSQVSGRSRLSWDESISLDVDYVRNHTFGRDMRILLQTVRAVVSQDGAY
jgi:lipopolysaccharide/colanic/teichoic acid biosynthesis glycosyltransferase